MDRRDFLRSLTAAAVAQALPVAASAARMPEWSNAFGGLRNDLPNLPLQVTGKFPEVCTGTLYRNGPALYERGGQRYEHLFDPDGMVQAYNISGASVSHRGRFVRTRKYLRESEAKRFLYGGAGTAFKNASHARNNEDFNVANISVRPFAGELLALWEAGSAYRIDPQTLETLGQKIWSDDLAGVPFSAHPRIDDRGELWNIGNISFTQRPMLALYHVSAEGKLLKQRFQTLDYAGYMHDFVLTPRYLIALNSSAVFGEGDTFVDRMQWQGDRPSQLLVFDRNDFSLRLTLEVPACFVFHFANAWEQGEEVFFSACQHRDMSIVSAGMRRMARQESGPYHNGPRLHRYSVSMRDRHVRVEALDTELEFPGFDQRIPFSPQPILGVGGQQQSLSGLASAVRRVDPNTGAVQEFDYGDDTIVEEPLFVAGPDGGYCLHSFLNFRKQSAGLAVLRARDLASGPVAVAQMQRMLPFGFHGSFVPGGAFAA